jgi:hypothetical protein
VANENDEEATVKDLLSRLPLTNQQRTAAWYAYFQSPSGSDLQNTLAGLSLPGEAKGRLQNLKYQTTGETPPAGALSRAASGAWSMINPIEMAKGAYQAVTSPIETVKGLAGAQWDQAKQAAALAQEGRYSEAAGHAGAAVLPVVGPIAAGVGEQIGSGDVAGGLGAAAGLLTPNPLLTTAKVAGAVTAKPAAAIARTIAPQTTARLAGALERGAATRVQQVMAPTVGGNKPRFGNIAADVAPKLAQDPAIVGTWTRQGFHNRVVNAFDEAGAGLDEAIAARNPVKGYDTKPISDALKDQRKKFTAEAVEGSRLTPTVTNLTKRGEETVLSKREAVPIGKDVVPGPSRDRVGMIDQAIAELEQLGPVAHFDDIRKIRASYDGPAKARYNAATTTDFLKEAGRSAGAADVTFVLRQKLAEFDPATAKANQRFALMKDAKDVLDALEEVERVRPQVGRQIVSRGFGMAAGATLGGPGGAAIGYFGAPFIDAALQTGGTTRLKTARALQDMAKAIRKQDVGKVRSLTYQLQKLVPEGVVSGRDVRRAVRPTLLQAAGTEPPPEQP